MNTVGSLKNFWDKWKKPAIVLLLLTAIMVIATIMDVVMETSVSLFIIFFTICFAVASLLKMAKRGWPFTYIEKGTVVYINAGDNMRDIWPNIDGYKQSEAEDPEGRRWLVRIKDKEEDKDDWYNAFFRNARMVWLQRLIWDTWGIRFISIWPGVRVYKIKVDKKRMTDSNDGSLAGRIKQSEGDPMADSLWFIIPRPNAFFTQMLGGDGSTVSIGCLPIYQLVIPALPAYYYKSDFFAPLDTAVESVFLNFLSTHKVAVYRQPEKGEKIDGEVGEMAHDTYNPDRWKELDPDCESKEKYKERYAPGSMTFSHLRKMKKSGGPLEQYFDDFNASAVYRERLRLWANGEKGKQATGNETTKEEVAGNETTKEEVAGTPEKEKRKEILEHLDYLTNDCFKNNQDKACQSNENVFFQKEPQGGGIIPRFGFALISLRIFGIPPEGETVKLQNAFVQKQTEQYTAQGVIERSRGIGEGTRLEYTGEAKGIEEMIEVQVAKGVDPNVASKTVRKIRMTANIGGKQSSVNTYFEGSSDRGYPPVAIPLNGISRSEKPSKKDSDSAPEEKLDL